MRLPFRKIHALYHIFEQEFSKRDLLGQQNKEVNMKEQKKAEKNLQWHPAFYASIQIEFKDDADNLVFENEHQLGTKPFGIDVLIIKKENDNPVQKNIGRIFRKRNIIEYKSPTDYLSIDDFYKVYGYSCFYKADVEETDSIKIEEITISLVCKRYPRKLIQHLQKERNYEIRKVEEGIFHVIGDKIPIQIIVTKYLSREENLWLRNLTDTLSEKEDAEKLIREYNKNRGNTLYSSVMNIIIQANRERFKEEKSMCEALDELLEELLEEQRDARIEAREVKARQQGKEQINELTKRLSQENRMDDIVKAANDKEYQEKLLLEFGL